MIACPADATRSRMSECNARAWDGSFAVGTKKRIMTTSDRKNPGDPAATRICFATPRGASGFASCGAISYGHTDLCAVLLASTLMQLRTNPVIIRGFLRNFPVQITGCRGQTYVQGCGTSECYTRFWFTSRHAARQHFRFR